MVATYLLDRYTLTYRINVVISDAVVATLAASCRHLAVVALEGCGITDAALISLAQLPLTEVDLWGQAISDEGVAYLAKSTPQLEIIWIGETGVTNAGNSSPRLPFVVPTPRECPRAVPRSLVLGLRLCPSPHRPTSS